MSPLCVCVDYCSGASTATGAGGVWQWVSGNSFTTGRFDAAVTLRGTDDTSSESSEDEADNSNSGSHRGTRWTQVGTVYVQFELLPQVLANERSCGQGRSAPNQFPELPPPVGRAKLSMNPFSNLSALLGPDLARTLCLPIAVCACCIFVLAGLVVAADVKQLL